MSIRVRQGCLIGDALSTMSLKLLYKIEDNDSNGHLSAPGHGCPFVFPLLSILAYEYI
jgi:hypothetical protein